MGEKYTEAQKRASMKYIKEKTDDIRIRVKKGKKEEYRAFAERQGKTLTSFITDLIEKELKKEKQSE